MNVFIGFTESVQEAVKNGATLDEALETLQTSVEEKAKYKKLLIAVSDNNFQLSGIQYITRKEYPVDKIKNSFETASRATKDAEVESIRITQELLKESVGDFDDFVKNVHTELAEEKLKGIGTRLQEQKTKKTMTAESLKKLVEELAKVSTAHASEEADLLHRKVSLELCRLTYKHSTKENNISAKKLAEVRVHIESFFASKDTEVPQKVKQEYATETIRLLKAKKVATTNISEQHQLDRFIKFFEEKHKQFA